VSKDKQRKARQRAERERWEREQQAGRVRRRRLLLVVSGAVTGAVVAAVVVAVVTSSGDEPSPRAEEPVQGSTEILASEAAADAQDDAAAAAAAAGEVIAEDFTAEPGTPVGTGSAPRADNRPVACGATRPEVATQPRPRFPGGPAAVLEDGVDYVARIETSCGLIVIDLLEQDAPVAVNSFVFLARQGFYDGLDVFRDFGAVTAVQTGSGDNSAQWDLGYTLPDELDLPRREGYPVGTVTTVSEGPYTAGSEFFIVYGPGFDSGYGDTPTQTTFGRVVRGMDVVETLTGIERIGFGGDGFAEHLYLESVTIQER
jgi:cyclophilin family peptidyl-prolyl cis-trans isomerase